MEEQMLYLGAQTTIKGNKIMKMSQFFQIISLQEQVPQPIPKLHSLLDSLRHKMKKYYAHGSIHTISKSSMENGGRSIEEW
jgi:hypothetical protein